MNEIDRLPSKELLELQGFVQELMLDSQHPVHNRNHPQHYESIIAIGELLDRSDRLELAF
jgi:hypothetical protein